MIFVDSSVWIDFLRGRQTLQVDQLDALLGSTTRLAVGDLILAEVLQGIPDDREFSRVRRTFGAFVQIDIAGKEIAVRAAQNFRALRRLGVTVRKTVDTLIATRCIADNLTLLHSDRDFDAFADHLGLKVHGSQARPTS